MPLLNSRDLSVPAIIIVENPQKNQNQAWEDSIDYTSFYAIVRDITDISEDTHWLPSTEDGESKEADKFAPTGTLNSNEKSDHRKFLVLAHMVKRVVTKTISQKGIESINHANSNKLREQLMENLKNNPTYSIVELIRIKTNSIWWFEWRVNPIVIN